MLVPQMSMEEMIKEVKNDLPILERKSGYHAVKLFKICSPIGAKTVIRLFDYYSKHKNKWIYKIHLSKQERTGAYITYFESEKGLCAIMPTTLANNNIHVFFLTSHFFNRYNERLQLKLIHPKDIISHFILHNEKLQSELIKEVNQYVYEIFAVTVEGVLLGHHDTKLNVVYINTFITHDMLKGEQVDRYKHMSSLLDEFLKEKYPVNPIQQIANK